MDVISVTGSVPVEGSLMSRSIDLLVETTAREAMQKASDQKRTIRDYCPPVITVTALASRPDEIEEWFYVTVTSCVRTIT